MNEQKTSETNEALVVALLALASVFAVRLANARAAQIAGWPRGGIEVDLANQARRALESALRDAICSPGASTSTES